jgi:AcrR family transcriptional regulator
MSRGAATTLDARREDILEAGRSIFIHYGFARASLDLIAREAGISRTGLYHHFRNKEEIFRAMVARLNEQSLAAASERAEGDGDFEMRLLNVLRAKIGWFFGQLSTTRHGNEILDESSRLCGEAVADATRRYHRIIAKLLRDADKAKRIDLARVGMTPDAAAVLITHSAYGLQGRGGGEIPTPEQYDKRLEQLCRVTVAGFGGATSRRGR